MTDSLLEPRLVRMPEFGPGTWLNTDHTSISRQQLRHHVVLIDFWDYTCINCVRTLPYLTRWYERYRDWGLRIIGVHAPEFKFGQIQTQIAAALDDHQITYPVLLDNQYETWSRFANKAWPTKYLIDGQGYIRFRRQGEGYYRETEKAIQLLLKQQTPDLDLPDLLPPLRAEDAPGAVCYRPTPELYAGYQGGGLFGGALGNPDGYQPQSPVFYDLPPLEQRQDGQFYVSGVWQAWPEALAFAGQSGGQVVLPYQAATVNAVLSPSADVVEVALDIRPSQTDPLLFVQQDGRSLDPHIAGADIEFAANGQSYVRVNRARLYQLVRNPHYAAHELTLTFAAPGLALYAFTFTTCTTPTPSADAANTIHVR
ncbi:MAG: redoxin domain-containing protein [Ardenticatenaceae bacterium]|nr:redoxin domain-containing protein [Ardenticatenaceae bacterium]